MDNLKIYKILAILACIILIVNWLFLMNSFRQPFSVRGKAAEGKPYYFEDARTYWSEVGDVAACGDYIFLMYDNLKILSCYDLSGNYLHSYSVEMMDNGTPHLYVKEDLLYLETKGHDFYTFEDGRFADFCEHNSPEADYLYEYLSVFDRWKTDNMENSYNVRGASVWYMDGDTEVKVIQRPRWLTYFQFGGIIHCVIHMICLGILVLLHLMWKGWFRNCFSPK